MLEIRYKVEDAFDVKVAKYKVKIEDIDSAVTRISCNQLEAIFMELHYMSQENAHLN